MFLSRLFRRSETRLARRPQARRRLLVDALEGRQLLTTFLSPDLGIVGNHIGTSVSAIVGNHIGTSVSAIVGNHIGTSVSEGMIKQ